MWQGVAQSQQGFNATLQLLRKYRRTAVKKHKAVPVNCRFRSNYPVNRYLVASARRIPCPLCNRNLSGLTYNDRVCHVDKCLVLNTNDSARYLTCKFCYDQISSRLMLKHLKTCATRHGIHPKHVVSFVRRLGDQVEAGEARKQEPIARRKRDRIKANQIGCDFRPKESKLSPLSVAVKRLTKMLSDTDECQSTGGGKRVIQCRKWTLTFQTDEIESTSHVPLEELLTEEYSKNRDHLGSTFSASTQPEQGNLENTSSRHEISRNGREESSDEVVPGSADILLLGDPMDEYVRDSRLDQSIQVLDKSLADKPQNNDTWDGYEEYHASSGFYQYPEECVNTGYTRDETGAQLNAAFEPDVLYPVDKSDHSSDCQIISCSPTLNLKNSTGMNNRGSSGTISKDRSSARGSRDNGLDSHSVICIDCSDEGDSTFGTRRLEFSLNKTLECNAAQKRGTQGTLQQESRNTCYHKEFRPQITLDYPVQLTFEDVFTGFNKVRSSSTPRAVSTPNRKRRIKIEGCSGNLKDQQNLKVKYIDPCTPEPSYDRMKTPELKREFSKIGLKTHYGKKRMIKTLKEVYKQTHQFETVLDENEDSGEDALADGRMQCEQANLYETVEDLGNECSLEESKLHVLQMKELILSNEEMYKRVLLYRPIPLNDIMTVVRQNGIKLDQKHVMIALDFLSVTFKLEQSRHGHVRKRCRKNLPAKQRSTQ